MSRTELMVAVCTLSLSMGLMGCGPEVSPGMPEGSVGTSVSALVTRTVTKVVTDGSAIETGYQDDLGYQHLAAFQSIVNGVSSTFVAYQRSTVDPASLSCVPDPILGTFCSYTRSTYELVNGEVRSGDLQVGTNTARLHSDISQAPGVGYLFCEVDMTAGTTTCATQAHNPIVDVTVARTNDSFSKYSGTHQDKVGPQTITVNGRTATYSGRPGGSVFGSAVPATSLSTLGTSKAVAVTVTITQQ